MADITAQVISTNVEGLDTLLGGGIPAGSFVMVAGGPGAGKTILLQQIAFTIARSEEAKTKSTQSKTSKGAGVLFFSTLSEPHDKLLQHIRAFSFYDEELLSTQIRLLSLTRAMEKGLIKISDEIVTEARRENPRLVIVDCLGRLEDLETSPTEFRWFLYRLSSILGTLGITLVVSLERNLEESGSTHGLTIADGIINLSTHLEGVELVRRVEVKKLRGMNMLQGLHTYQISDNGLTFFPRLEALVKTQGEANPAGILESIPLKTSGLPELDRLAGGGIPATSSTIIAGAPGTGKTFLSLKYLHEGVQIGEAGLYVGFKETSEQLLAKANRLGMDLQSGINQGLAHFLTLNPVELNPDFYAYRIRQVIEQARIQRLVIDCLPQLELACQSMHRRHNFFMALMSYLKFQNVTPFYIYEVSKLATNEFDLVNTPFSIVAENLLLLKEVEYRDRFFRYLRVLKMSDNKFDSTIREFTLEDRAGLRVLEVEQSTEGLLKEITVKTNKI